MNIKRIIKAVMEIGVVTGAVIMFFESLRIAAIKVPSLALNQFDGAGGLK